jgi:DNA-binding XRE family transcriptional regulator
MDASVNGRRSPAGGQGRPGGPIPASPGSPRPDVTELPHQAGQDRIPRKPPSQSLETARKDVGGDLPADAPPPFPAVGGPTGSAPILLVGPLLMSTVGPVRVDIPRGCYPDSVDPEWENPSDGRVAGTGKGTTPMQQEFGDRVRRLRHERGLSQEELAHRSGIHRSYIGSLEAGERNISLNNLCRLARALGLDAGDLVTGLQALPGRG